MLTLGQHRPQEAMAHARDALGAGFGSSTVPKRRGDSVVLFLLRPMVTNGGAERCIMMCARASGAARTCFAHAFDRVHAPKAHAGIACENGARHIPPAQGGATVWERVVKLIQTTG